MKTKRSEREIMSDIFGIYCDLSPENISWDGERSRAEVKKATKKLRAQLNKLFKELGKTVNENEFYDYGA